MRMGQGVRTVLGHGGITCVLQTQFSSFVLLLKSLELRNDLKMLWNLQNHDKLK